MNFGPVTEEADSHKIMDQAHDNGINFFDTANVYGWGENKGRTEEIVGSWFAQGRRSARSDRARHQAVRRHGRLAQRGQALRPQHPAGLSTPACGVCRPTSSTSTRCTTSTGDTPWDEIWQAMDVLVAQGKILYVGSSNFAGWHIAQAQAAAAERHVSGLVSEQSIYNLLVRDIEREVVPAAESYGVGIIPWSPLQGGLLGGVIRKEREGHRRTSGRAEESLEAHREQIEQYEDLCEEIGHEPAEVGLAWLLTRPGRHRAHRGAAHDRPARLGGRRAAADPRPVHAGPAGRDLSRPQDVARGLRLVTGRPDLPHGWDGHLRGEPEIETVPPPAGRRRGDASRRRGVWRYRRAGSLGAASGSSSVGRSPCHERHRAAYEPSDGSGRRATRTPRSGRPRPRRPGRHRAR